MIKISRIRARGCIQLPDTFLAFTKVIKGDEVETHFGSNFHVIVIVAKGSVLSKDNQERIRILTDVR